MASSLCERAPSFSRTSATGSWTPPAPYYHLSLIISANNCRWSRHHSGKRDVRSVELRLKVCAPSFPRLAVLVSNLRCWPLSHNQPLDLKEKQHPQHSGLYCSAMMFHRLGTSQCLLFFLVLGINPIASSKQGKQSTAELYPSPLFTFWRLGDRVSRSCLGLALD